jgi:hypothetical protein
LALDGTLDIPSGTLNVSGMNIPATPLTFNNSFNITAGKTVTKTGGQALNINAPQSHGANAVLAIAQGTANINTNGGANLTVNTSGAGSGTNLSVTQNLKAVGVGTGGTVTITPSARGSAGKTLAVTSLNMTGGKLDIRNNSVIVNWSGTDPYPALLDALMDGRNGFGWDGDHGITSSDAAAGGQLTSIAIAPATVVLGIGENEQGLWAGQQVDGTTWLLKYTYDGDLNLDGLIDASDYGIIDNYFQFPGSTGYFNGDFNFDGIIYAGDYGLIDNGFQLQGAPIFSPYGALSVTAVPEPSACGFAILMVAATATSLRRRRQRKQKLSHLFPSPTR